MVSSSSRASLGSQIFAVLVLALINYSFSGADARKLTFAKEISKATKAVTNYKPAEQLLGVEKGKALTEKAKDYKPAEQLLGVEKGKALTEKAKDYKPAEQLLGVKRGKALKENAETLKETAARAVRHASAHVYTDMITNRCYTPFTHTLPHALIHSLHNAPGDHPVVTQGEYVADSRKGFNEGEEFLQEKIEHARNTWDKTKDLRNELGEATKQSWDITLRTSHVTRPRQGACQTFFTVRQRLAYCGRFTLSASDTFAISLVIYCQSINNAHVVRAK